MDQEVALCLYSLANTTMISMVDTILRQKPMMGDFAIMGCIPKAVPEPSSAILLISG